MKESSQIINKIEWLDEQRRSDRKIVVELRERISAFEAHNRELLVRIAEMESEIKKAKQLSESASKVDEIIDKNRSDFITSLENIESLRTKSEVEMERLRILDRDAVNKTISNMQDNLGKLRDIDEKLSIGDEETRRLRSEMSELTISINNVIRMSDQVEHKIITVEERSIQDGKRISDFKGDLNNLRILLDEIRPKLESLEDVNLSNHNHINDLVTMENDRQVEQSTWIEQQTVALSERERWWSELQEKSKEIETTIQESALRMEEFRETHSDMKHALSNLDNNFMNVENKISDFTELQRHTLDRHKEEWKVFVEANDQQWTEHQLTRVEQWKENDRVTQKFLKRLENIEEDVKEVIGLVSQMRSMDQDRLKEIFSAIRKFLAVYEKPAKKVP
tara:strand:+ start:30821 stop:32002 length:1182 start_codon:yes stop_codon:yes gene_type:complete